MVTAAEPAVPDWGLRTWLDTAVTFPSFVLALPPWTTAHRDWPALFEYGLTTWSRNKRTPVDVPALVQKTHEYIVGIYTAHSREDVDRFDYMEDEILGAIFGAPIAQLREFYPLLADALEADPRVPLFVWEPYKGMAEHVTKAADEDVIRLKTELAESIAKMAEHDLAPQIQLALVNALKWRAPETLEKVDRLLKEGQKPRLTGRSSCLFLEVGDGEEAAKVML